MVSILFTFGSYLAKVALPFLLLYTIYVVFFLRALTGHLLAFEKLKLKFDKFSLDKIFKNLINKLNLFHVKNIVELVKCFIKFLIVGFCGYSVLMARKHELFLLTGMSLEPGFKLIGNVLFQMIAMMCVAIIILGF